MLTDEQRAEISRRTKDHSERCRFINARPIVASLLYDLSLLPEVCATIEPNGGPATAMMCNVLGHLMTLEAEARAEEQEACAKVCDDAVCTYNSNEQDMLAKQLAFLIRARKDDHG